MSYKYLLSLFYVRQSPVTGGGFRPALLLSQIGQSPAFTAIHVFENSDALMSWIIDSKLLSYQEVIDLEKQFRSANNAQKELGISPQQAAQLVPPLSPLPGEVEPSPEFRRKVEALNANREGNA